MTNTISAMDLRRQAGDILNQIYYQNQSIVVERSGEPMAVLIPIRRFKQMEDRKQQARARVLEIAQEISSTFTASGLSEDEARTLIEQEVEEVRSQEQLH